LILKPGSGVEVKGTALDHMWMHVSVTGDESWSWQGRKK